MTATTIDFGSVYELKNFMISELAPKYFDLNDVNQFNVGLLGYTTEAMSVTTEESFNAMNTMYKEYFITKATFPETIYAEAGVLGIDAVTAQAANVNCVLFIKKEDIIKKGTVNNNTIHFTLDRDTVIDIEDLHYSLDYDINIVARPDRSGDFVITAQYNMAEKNVMSPLTHPFIKLHRAIVTSTEYVGLFITLRQFERTELIESLITSNKINFPTIDVNFEDMYAGMDVFYFDPIEQKEVRLELKILGAPPIKAPFIYYEHVDGGTIRLSFTTRDNYFRPEFNSELRIVTYTTKGAGGNFKSYNGPNINVINSTSERIQYLNGAPVMFAAVVGPSVGGKDTQSIEQLRASIIEKKASSGAYNTETDLENYFNNRASEMVDTFLKFIKRRDDLVERLFSCFGLFREPNGNYYPTNTLNMEMYEHNFDLTYDNGNRMIIRPGRKFNYKWGSRDTVAPGGIWYGRQPGPNSGDITTFDMDFPSFDDFEFVNPYLISVQKDPNSVTYYNNSVDSTIPMDYKFNDVNSPHQFIINNLSVTRNAVLGDYEYKFRVNMKPNFELQYDEEGYPILPNGLTVVLSFEEGGADTKAIIMELIDFNPTDTVLTFEANLETDDEINQNSKIVINNLYDIDSDTEGYETVPMMDAIVNVSILVEDPLNVGRYNPFRSMMQLSDHAMISKYSTESNPVTLVRPMKHIRSRLSFIHYYYDEDYSEYSMLISLSPFVGSSLSDDNERLMKFLLEVQQTYEYIDRLMDRKTNNYSMDIKFYNTYGRSNNFVVDEEKNPLDRVNLSFGIQVAFEFGTILEEAIPELKEKIKTYIENINNSVNTNLATRGFNGVYVSNLIQEIENEYPVVRYMKFKQINEYDSSVQVVENGTVDITSLAPIDRRTYVPEFLTIDVDNITVDIL